MTKGEESILASFGRMYALHTVENMYYGAPLNTYATHYQAWLAGNKLGGWYDIERIL